MPTFTLAPRRRRLVGAVGATAAGALVAATLTVAPAAQAATPVNSPLTWSISGQFVNHLSTRTLSDGAAFDAAASAFTFPSASTVVAGDGTVTRTYEGTVKGAFVNGSTEYYSVTVSDPVVTVTASGAGTVKATVSSVQNVSMGPSSPAGSTTPTEVVVADLTGTTTASQAITPAWAGVLAADSTEATALGIPAGEPIEGKSFNTAFLGQIMAGIRSHFYGSATNSSDVKAPGVLSIDPVVSATVTASSYADGVTISVAGTGFNPRTNPGDNGVYAMLAPADTVIDYADMNGTMALAAGVAYAPAATFSADSFSTSLNAPTSKLDPTKSYALFTWQAHTHSNPGQDTKTPVTIDWSTLTAPLPVATESTAVAKVKKAKLGKKVTAKVTIKGQTTVPTGKVTVTLKKGKKTVKAKSATLDAQGKAKVKLAKLKKAGKYKVVVKYAGDDTNKAVKKVTKFKVKG